MTNNGWDRLEYIFHDALELSGARRDKYLAEACAGDMELRSQLESLLLAFEKDAEFLDEPVLEMGLSAFGESRMDRLVGLNLGRYVIGERLGSGGMGDVYIAEDTSLNRRVAVKFLKETLLDDGWAKRQFVREAQAVAMLQHENVCAVHGIEEIDGLNFIVMQYVDGLTLSEYLSDRDLGPDEILDLSRQIAAALAAAHAQNIIHRDIKPGNIIITPDRKVKVLDFGLAKFVQQRREQDDANTANLSQNGLILGTVAYMSPEQLRSERLDFRTDIFSVGIVFHELIAKSNPFARKSQAEMIAAIIDDQPVTVKALVPGLPAAFAGIVGKCLSKNKERRFQSAAELLVEIEGVAEKRAAGPGFGLTGTIGKTIAGGVLVAFIALLIGTLVYFGGGERRPELAVLPFSNATGSTDLDYLSDGLTEALAARLSSVRSLRTRPQTQVAGLRGQAFDPQRAGADLGVDAVLSGQLVKEGETLLLRSTLTNVADGRALWTKDYQVGGAELENSQTLLATSVTASLNIAVSAAEKRRLGRKGDHDSEASRQYFVGRYYWNNRNRENIQKAVEHYQNAIDIEPSYAEAWSGIADAYMAMSTPAYGSLPVKEATNKAKAALLRSIEFDDSRSETYASLGAIKMNYEWDWAGAEENFVKAIEVNPDYAQAHLSYSMLLIVKRQFDRAMAEAEKAKELDSLSPSYSLQIGRVWYYSGRNDLAQPVYASYYEANPTNKNAAYMYVFSLLKSGSYEKAIEISERFYVNDKLYFAAPLGYAYGKAGRRQDALRILDDLQHLSNDTNVPAQEKAIIFLGIDDKAKAIESLSQSCEARFPPFPFLMIDGLLEDLRDERRFADLRRCAALPA